MLKRLQVNNFQRISEVDIDLGSITLIVGPNGSGKTAILRALKALCFNRRGDDFIRKGGDESMVLLTRSDGGVGWVKERGSSATYDLLLSDEVAKGEQSQQWSKTGTSVPEEVSEFLHIQPIQIDKGYTLTPQFPGPLNRDILAESPSRIARIIGVLTRLDIVVNAQRAARTDKTTASGQQDQAQLDVDKAKTLLDGLQWVEPMCTKLDEIEQLFQQIDEAQDQLDDGRAIVAALVGVRITLAREENVTRARQLLYKSELLGEELRTVPIERWQAVQAALTTEEPIAQARKLIHQASPIGHTIGASEPLVTRWGEIAPMLAGQENVAKARQVLTQAVPLVETLPKASALVTQHEELIDDIETLCGSRDQHQGYFNTARAAYDQACKDCQVCDHCPFEMKQEATA